VLDPGRISYPGPHTVVVDDSTLEGDVSSSSRSISIRIPLLLLSSLESIQKYKIDVSFIHDCQPTLLADHQNPINTHHT
jgi:hypothetical protein